MGTLPNGVAAGKAGARLTVELPSGALHVTAAPPETISQRTSLAVVGVPPRSYLEAVRAPGFPLKVGRLGKLRCVDRAAFVLWLLSRGGEQGADNDAGAEELPVDDDAALAAELGLERTKAPTVARKVTR